MKNSRTRLSELKMQNALNFLRENYSTTEYRDWNPTEVATTFEIGANFVNTLERIGAIKRINGNRNTKPKLMLTTRFATLKPSTLRRNMNKFQQEYVKAKQKETKAINPTNKTKTNKRSNLGINEILIMLKEEMRSELLQEIKDQLRNELSLNK